MQRDLTARESPHIDARTTETEKSEKILNSWWLFSTLIDKNIVRDLQFYPDVRLM